MIPLRGFGQNSSPITRGFGSRIKEAVTSVIDFVRRAVNKIWKRKRSRYIFEHLGTNQMVIHASIENIFEKDRTMGQLIYLHEYTDKVFDRDLPPITKRGTLRQVNGENVYVHRRTLKVIEQTKENLTYKHKKIYRTFGSVHKLDN